MRARAVFAWLCALAGFTGWVSASPLRAQSNADADSVEAVGRERGGDDTALEVRPPSARSLRGVALTFVSGSREMEDVRVGASWLQARYRVVDGREAGFLRVGGRRARVFVGRARLRAGEFVLLGRTFSGLPAANGGGAPGFEVVPTASLWYGHSAIAAEAMVSRWRVSVSGIRSHDAIGHSPAVRSVWTSVAYSKARSNYGAAAGWLPVDARPRALTVFGRFSAGGVGCAMECARVRSRMFAALRLSAPGGRVALRLFRMPDDPATNAFARDMPMPRRTMTGGAVAVRGRAAGVTLRGAFVGAERREAGVVRRTTRAAFLGRRRLSPATVGEVEVVAIDDETLRGSLHPLVDTVGIDAYRRGTVRFELRVRPGAMTSHRMRITFVREVSGAGGVVTTVGSALYWKRATLDLRVSGYALDAGVRGYISRPGVATFEHVSAVFGHGSDAALRIRVRAGWGWRLVAVAASGTRGANRLYLAAEFHR